MNIKIVSVMLVVTLVGCYRTERVSLTEPGRIVLLTYSPAQHGSGTGVGLSSGGDMVVTSTSVDLAAVYGVVFECKHGSFAVQMREKDWKAFRQGDSVTIHYDEIWRVRENRPKQFMDYDFLYATPLRGSGETPQP